MFSVVENYSTIWHEWLQRPTLKPCLDEPPHCSRVHSVVLQSLWEKKRRFCKTFCNDTVWCVSHQSVCSLQSPTWTSAGNPAARVPEASRGVRGLGTVKSTDLDLPLLGSLQHSHPQLRLPSSGLSHWPPFSENKLQFWCNEGEVADLGFSCYVWVPVQLYVQKEQATFGLWSLVCCCLSAAL